MSGRRFKTGEECTEKGDYRFDGYTDGPTDTDGTLIPSPTSDEQLIPLSKGETFPPIRSTNKACWRVKV